jgi:membrane-bound lytic murein transglycosylase F
MALCVTGARARRAVIALTAVVLGMGAGCTRREPPLLEQIQQRGELRVATLNSPTAYYLGTHGPEGLEYALASRFAAGLGVRLRVVTAGDREGLRAALADGRADLAAAQLTFHRRWERVGTPAEPYAEGRMLWAYRRGQPRPGSTPDLQGRRIAVPEGSAASDYLDAHPKPGGVELNWEVIPRRQSLDGLEAVRIGRADITLVDANEYTFARPMHPESAIAFAAAEARPLQWIVRRDARDLLAAVNAFFAEEQRSGRLRQVMDIALRPPVDLTRNTLREFTALIDARLTALQPLFEQASVQTGVDWRLLAALAYQESQWNPAARSPDGALGIMMLMPETARSLNVADPFDARESINAGARYFVKVREQIPRRIPEPDRSWFAIASYNMGYGHVEDARVITQKLGGDPDRWDDVARNMPLLSEEAWYLQARHGYARGWEAAYTVERVREFARVLEWRTAGRALVNASPGTASAADAAPGRSPAAESGSPRPAR